MEKKKKTASRNANSYQINPLSNNGHQIRNYCKILYFLIWVNLHSIIFPEGGPQSTIKLQKQMFGDDFRPWEYQETILHRKKLHF